MKRVFLTKNDLKEIQHFNALLSLSGEELIAYMDKNGIAHDMNYGEITMESNGYHVELCIFSGDEISPAFWGEARLVNANGDMIYHSEPLDDFNEFYVEDDEVWGCTFNLNENESFYDLREEFEC